MKVLAKRGYAMLIDAFVLGTVYEIIRARFPNWNHNFDVPLMIGLLALYFLKDSMFGNASIGKLVMGIRIFSRDWKKPSIKTLYIRSFLMYGWGYIYVWRSVFIDGNKLRLFDWELEKTNTLVIDVRIYESIKEKAKKMDGPIEKNMYDLYCNYIQKIYG